MQLGYFTMPLHPPGSDPAETLEADLVQMETLDRLGYREAWIGEHFTTVWENIPAPDQFIAAALPRTKNIIFGTGVTCMPNHDPFMIAHRIAQLDNLARGRFQWGVGSGGFPGDFEVFGFDPSTGAHRGMSQDSIELILQMWQDPEPGTYQHPYWKFVIPKPVPEIGLQFHLKPYQKPHPPIGVAGVSPKSDTLVFAGEKGWLPLSINLVPTETLKTHWEAVEEGARKTGLTPNRSEWRVAREVYIADTTEQARDEVLEGTIGRDFRGYFIPLMAHMKLLSLFKGEREMPDEAVTPEYLVDNVWIVGSPEDVTEKLRQMYQEVGGFGVLLAMGHEWQPEDKWVSSMTRLAQEVMPRLADLS
jgi:alkanesulfonate monooxygenase SsuD/methylene tetrahydromethanopterin reductase-like flavin-dependent oxidoreductase (luciferase family)